MMKILVDADLLLEALLNRNCFAAEAEDAYQILQSDGIQAYISELGLDKIFSCLRKLEGSEKAEEIIAVIQEIVETCYLDSNLIQQARALNLKDFESAVEVVCAITKNFGAILTQNPQVFAEANLSILQVHDLLERQHMERILRIDELPVLFVSDLQGLQNLEDILKKYSEKQSLQPHPASEDILDLTIEDILGKDNPSAYSTLTAIERSLRQFHLNSQIEATEVLAEAYLRGKKFLQSGQSIHNPHAWLKKTAFNVIRERSRQCRKHRVEPYEEDKISEDPITNLVDIQEIENDLADLRQAIKLLAEEDLQGAKLLYLKIIQGLSWQEIHDILVQHNKEAANLATLRQRASRAKKRLRHLFHSIT